MRIRFSEISRDRVTVMVFNAAFNNISVKSWLSVLLVGEARVPEKTTHLPYVIDRLYHIMLCRLHLAMSAISGDRH